MMSRRAILIAVVVVVAVFAGGLVVGRLISPESRTSARSTVPPTEPSPSTQPSPAESTTRTTRTVVPDLTGLLLSQAAQVLGSTHFTVGDLAAWRSPLERGTVLSQGL